MNVHIPQFLWLSLALLSGGINLAKAGQRREGLAGKYNPMIWLIGFLLELWMLWAGGFFK